MQEPPESNSPQPLIFRSYRRHRLQSRWGSASLLMPVVAGLWCVFWYLVMSKPRLPGAAQQAGAANWLALVIGAALFSIVGIVLAALGLRDRQHKHDRAALGLGLNAIFLVAIGIAHLVRMLANAAP